MARRFFFGPELFSTLDLDFMDKGAVLPLPVYAPLPGVLAQDITGTNSSETLEGTEEDDVILGLGGNDIINGNGGNDVLDGGTGSNTLTGGAGADIFGNAQRGGTYTNTVTDFTVGEDQVDLRAFNIGSLDVLIDNGFLQQDGQNTVLTFLFDNRFETIVLEGIDRGDLTTDEFVFNDSLDPIVIDFANRNTSFDLFGGNGNDTIVSGSGRDKLYGGAGNDVLDGGRDTNTLVGGDGEDVFVIGGRYGQTTTINDFTADEDQIDLSVFGFSDLGQLDGLLVQDGNDVVLTTLFDNRRESLIIEGADLGQLSANDFILNESLDPLVQDFSGRSTSFTLFGGSGDDTLLAGSGNDDLRAGAGDDVLNGGVGTNTLSGGAGADTFVISVRSFRNDTITDFEIGTDRIDIRALNVGDFDTLRPFLEEDGGDVVLTTQFDNRSETLRIENVTIAELEANDAFRFNTFTGGVDIDVSNRTTSYTLFGGNGDDEIVTGGGNDRISGGQGDDLLDAGAGTNTIYTGEGADTIVLRRTGSVETTIVDFTQGQDIIDVRSFNIAEFDVLLVDLIQDGDDVVFTSFYNGRNERVRILNTQVEDLTRDDFRFNTNTADLVITGPRNSALYGGNGNDTITATSSFNELVGGAGDDTLTGASGEDYLEGGQGADILDGGAGDLDLISYLSSAQGVTIDLAAGTASGGDAQGDTFTNVEGVRGSEFADAFTGGDADERFFGQGGDDVIDAGGGDDTVRGGAGNDVVRAGDGGDDIEGGAGDDVLDGGLGRDTIRGGEGNDTLLVTSGDRAEGGLGDDRVEYAGRGEALTGAANVFGGDGSTSDEDTGFDVFAYTASDYALITPGLFGRGFTVYNRALATGDTSQTDQIFIAQFEAIEFEGILVDLSRDNPSLTQTGQNFLSEDSEFVTAFTNGNVTDIFALGGNDFVQGNVNSQNIFGGSGSDLLFGYAGDDVLSGDNAVALTGIEGEVFRAYQAVLGRAPDEAGFNITVDSILLGQQTQLDVIQSFIESPEFQDVFGELNNREFVEQLYRNVFGREGDAEGVNAFTAALDNGELTRAEAVQALANSDEFLNLTTLTGAAFATNVTFDPIEGDVFRIYQGVLGREPDDAGFQLFVDAIRNGILTRLEVTAEFVNSPEFQDVFGDLDNQAFVEQLYRNVLGREGDAGGIAAFTAALNNGDLTRAEAVDAFVTSFEFRSATREATLEYTRDLTEGVGNDVLDGGVGDDVMFGGRGEDVFVYAAGESSTGAELGGRDIVLDFEATNDTLRIFAEEAYNTFAELMAAASQEGNDVFFNFGDGNTLTLRGIALSDLTEDNVEVFNLDGSVPDTTGGTAAEVAVAAPKADIDPVSEVALEDFADLLLDTGGLLSARVLDNAGARIETDPFGRDSLESYDSYAEDVLL